MDLVKLSLAEFEYFKLAKRIETFAFRCHYFEVSINRMLDLLSALNKRISESAYSDQTINVPVQIYNLDTNIHWSYYVRFLQMIPRCHQSLEVEWVNPISLSNQLEQDVADGEETLKGLQLSKSVLLVKVMLMDLREESLLIEEERERLISDYHDPKQSDIKGFFNSFVRIDADQKKIEMKMIVEAEEAGDINEVNLLKEMFLRTPFQIAHDIINESLIPQIDSILSNFSALDQSDDT